MRFTNALDTLCRKRYEAGSISVLLSPPLEQATTSTSSRGVTANGSQPVDRATSFREGSSFHAIGSTPFASYTTLSRKRKLQSEAKGVEGLK